jgi:hypothetical protein
VRLKDGDCVGRRGFYAGRRINLGLSALLDLGGIEVVVVSIRTQCADPATWWCYHGAKNSRSIGIGIAQGSRARRGALPDSLVTIEAVDSAAELIELLWDSGRIVSTGGVPAGSSITTCGWKPPVLPKVKAPSQTIPVARCFELWAAFGRLVLGHGHCGKKVHDPGEHVWARLLARPGWQRVWP